MAVLQRIRQFFVASEVSPEAVVPASATTYEVRPLTDKQLKEVWKLNQRCFTNGEDYPKSTLSYLLSATNALSYRAVTPKDEMVGFIFVTVQDGTAHLTTVGVAPEHRRRRRVVHIDGVRVGKVDLDEAERIVGAGLGLHLLSPAQRFLA